MKHKTLINLISLDCKVAIYVPGTVEIDTEFCNEEQVRKTLEFLADTFGGSTENKAMGAWKTANGNLVTENVSYCFSFCTSEQLEQNIERVYSYCLEMKKEMGQEAVSLEVNNVLYFV